MTSTWSVLSTAVDLPSWHPNILLLPYCAVRHTIIHSHLSVHVLIDSFQVIGWSEVVVRTTNDVLHAVQAYGSLAQWRHIIMETNYFDRFSSDWNCMCIANSNGRNHPILGFWKCPKQPDVGASASLGLKFYERIKIRSTHRKMAWKIRLNQYKYFIFCYGSRYQYLQ